MARLWLRVPVLPAHHRPALGHTDTSHISRTDRRSLGKSPSALASEPFPKSSHPPSTLCLCDTRPGCIKPTAQRTRNHGSHGHTPTTLQKAGKLQGTSGTVIYLTFPEYIYPCDDLYKHTHCSIWVGIYLYVPVSKYQQVFMGPICRWGDDDRQGAVIPPGCSSGGDSLGLVSLGEEREGAPWYGTLAQLSL